MESGDLSALRRHVLQQVMENGAPRDMAGEVADLAIHAMVCAMDTASRIIQSASTTGIRVAVAQVAMQLIEQEARSKNRQITQMMHAYVEGGDAAVEALDL